MGRVDGKVAIVTGGSLGIGAATCKVLAKEGARVAVTDVASEPGQRLAEEINGSGGIVGFWEMDTSNEESVERAFSDIRDQFGRIDVLVNNAGISGANKPTDQLTEEEWDRVMDVNVKGYSCVQSMPYRTCGMQGEAASLTCHPFMAWLVPPMLRRTMRPRAQ